jgi:hypothetical protein
MAARSPVTATQTGVGSAQQHQEERSISCVSGRGSLAFRASHNDLPFGRTNTPIPCTTTLFQLDLKDGELMRQHSGPSRFPLVADRQNLPIAADWPTWSDSGQFAGRSGVIASQRADHPLFP